MSQKEDVIGYLIHQIYFFKFWQNTNDNKVIAEMGGKMQQRKKVKTNTIKNI